MKSNLPQVASHPVIELSPSCSKVHKFQQPQSTSRCRGATTVAAVVAWGAGRATAIEAASMARNFVFRAGILRSWQIW